MELLERLVKAFGPSGREDDAAEVITGEIKNYVDEVRRDSLGNVIALKKGSGLGKMMVVSHMDQIGVVITAVEENGILRFSSIGHYKPSDILHHHVVFKNGTVGTTAFDGEFEDIKIGSLTSST